MRTISEIIENLAGIEDVAAETNDPETWAVLVERRDECLAELAEAQRSAKRHWWHEPWTPNTLLSFWVVMAVTVAVFILALVTVEWAIAGGPWGGR